MFTMFSFEVVLFFFSLFLARECMDTRIDLFRPSFDFLRCFLCFTCRIFRLRSACAVIFAELTTVCTDALGHFHRIVRTHSLVYNIVYFTSRQERFYNLLYSMTPGQNLGVWHRRYLPELVLY